MMREVAKRLQVMSNLPKSEDAVVLGRIRKKR